MKVSIVKSAHRAPSIESPVLFIPQHFKSVIKDEILKL